MASVLTGFVSARRSVAGEARLQAAHGAARSFCSTRRAPPDLCLLLFVPGKGLTYQGLGSPRGPGRGVRDGVSAERRAERCAGEKGLPSGWNWLLLQRRRRGAAAVGSPGAWRSQQRPDSGVTHGALFRTPASLKAPGNPGQSRGLEAARPEAPLAAESWLTTVKVAAPQEPQDAPHRVP